MEVPRVLSSLAGTALVVVALTSCAKPMSQPEVAAAEPTPNLVATAMRAASSVTPDPREADTATPTPTPAPTETPLPTATPSPEEVRLNEFRSRISYYLGSYTFKDQSEEEGFLGGRQSYDTFEEELNADYENLFAAEAFQVEDVHVTREMYRDDDTLNSKINLVGSSVKNPLTLEVSRDVTFRKNGDGSWSYTTQTDPSYVVRSRFKGVGAFNIVTFAVKPGNFKITDITFSDDGMVHLKVRNEVGAINEFDFKGKVEPEVNLQSFAPNSYPILDLSEIHQ